MTELIFLGIGAIRPETPGDHTAMLLRHGDANVLIDAGPTIMIQLARAGVSPDEISHIFFTHQHGDHTLGSPMLLFYHRPRTILGAPKVLDAWRQLLDVVYPGYVHVLAAQLNFHPLPVMKPHMWPDLPGVTAKIALVHHADLPAYALRLDFAPTGDTPAFSICYSGDTTPTECVVEMAQGVDLLVHEATFLAGKSDGSDSVHTNARQAGEIAKKAGVRTLALVHRLAGNDNEWRIQAAEAFDGPILIPVAGDVLALPDDL